MTPLVTQALVPQVPIIASIPHGGHDLPAEIAEALVVDPERIYLDWFTPNLYSFLPNLGIASVVARGHRVVVDVNRRPVEPLVGRYLRDVVASTLGDDPLYAVAVSESEARGRVTMAHAPYHAALDALIASSLSRFSSIVLLDLHSFGRPLGVDVVLGDGRGTTAGSGIVDALEACFRAEGFSVQRNDPWTGGWIIKRFAEQASVHAVLVEVNQRVYLDGAEIDRLEGSRPTFDEARIEKGAARLSSVLDRFNGVVTAGDHLVLSIEGET